MSEKKKNKQNDSNLSEVKIEDTNNKENTPKEKKPISKKRLWTFIGGGIGIVVIILFAIFVFNPTQKVSFFTDGGTKISPLIINKETGLLEEIPTIPTKHGWEFVGWYTNSELTGNPIDLETYQFIEYEIGQASGEQIPVKDKDGNVIATSTTIYAKWELSKYYVTFYYYSGENEGQQIIINDDEGNEITYYYHIPHNPTNDEVNQYLAENPSLSRDEAYKIVEAMVATDRIAINQLTNIDQLINSQNVTFYNENGQEITDLRKTTTSEAHRIYVEFN